jgi:metal-dependent hydrolase (beta-lactamase superfamily II)
MVAPGSASTDRSVSGRHRVSGSPVDRGVASWGYAALVEMNGKRILFDTGDDPQILANNVKAKGVDLTRLDFVVLSHRHGDHMGGLTYLLSVNPKEASFDGLETYLSGAISITRVNNQAARFGVYRCLWNVSAYRSRSTFF